MSRWSTLYWVSGFALGCGNTGAPAEDYGPLLGHLASDVVLPEHRAFAGASDDLVSAVQALSDQPDADSLQAAEAAWRSARKAYRSLDALHFGPGYTLHIVERIDVSPVDADGIEAVVSGVGSIDDAAVDRLGGRRKGFLGLEYLLFAEPGTTTTAPVLAADEAAPQRRALALGMAHEIARSAHELDAAWEPGQGGYATEIELAGRGSKTYASERAAVDDAVGGVAYALELIVGVRLAQPLGKKSGGTPVPALDPTWRSDNAVADMQASLEGALALYAGQGFSAVLHVKSVALDSAVLSEFMDAQAKLSAISAPFAGTLVSQTAVVQAAYDSNQALKKTWNTDVSSALGATVKPSDNDGD